MKQKVREWIEFAKIDLLAANRLSDDKNLTPAAAFHAHQCIEKAFKAIMEYSEKPVTKIHDLNRLFNETKNIIQLKIDEDVLDDLSRLYIDSRYPAMTGLTPYGIPPVNDVKRYIDTAAVILEHVQKIIN